MDDDLLARFLAGKFPPEDFEKVARYLESHPELEPTLRQLEEQNDTLVMALRSGSREKIPDDIYRQLEEKATGLIRPRARPESLPKRLGQYELMERLGQGGMGTVYRAIHTNLQKQFAVKVLHPDRLTSAESIARFEREMKALASLHHPNIVQATDGGYIDERYCLVMECLDGVDAARLVERAGPLPIADAAEIAYQAAMALGHAAESGLVHRDIKPSNLLICADGTVKLLDLGLARLLENTDDELTQSGQLVGTLEYMAPEQAAGARTIDIRADLYSLGCTLYKLLTGVTPYSGSEFNSPLRKIAGHAEMPFTPLRSRRSDVPAQLAAIVDKLLIKDPDGRFSSPAEVAKELAPLRVGSHLQTIVSRVSQQGEANRTVAGIGSARSAQDAGEQRYSRLPLFCGAGLVLGGLAAIAALYLFWDRATEPAVTQSTARSPAIDTSPKAVEPQPDSRAKQITPPSRPVPPPDTPVPLQPEIQTAKSPTDSQGTDFSLQPPKNQQPAKLPLPSEDGIRAARVLIRDVFRDEYASAKTPGEKLALAKLLIEQGKQTNDDQSARYVLFLEARDLATSIGEVVTALNAVELIAAEYEIDVLTSKMHTLQQSSQNVRFSKGTHALVESLFDVIEQALKAEVAQELAEVAGAFAPKLQDLPLARRALELKQTVNERQAAYQAVNEALARLDQNPDDPAAALTVGRNLCFIKRDWDAGLTLLAKSSDPVLASIARADIDAPTQTKQQLELADRWFELAEQAVPGEQDAIESRAALWYRQCHSRLEGLQKLKAAKRLEHLGDVAFVQMPERTEHELGQPAASGEWLPGMIGRTQFKNRDLGIVFRYQLGKTFEHAVISQAVLESGAEMRGIKVSLEGHLHVPAKMAIIVWLAGGSPSGGVHRLFIGGREIDSVGDDRKKNKVTKLMLPAGIHPVGLRMSGGHYGNTHLVFLDPATNRPLFVGHTRREEREALAAPLRKDISNSTDRKLPKQPAEPDNTISLPLKPIRR